MVSIINNVVHGGPAFYIPAHISFGQYVVDKFRAVFDTEEGSKVAMVRYYRIVTLIMYLYVYLYKKLLCL